MTVLALLPMTFVLSALAAGLLVRQVRRYALRRDILDIPNARSSHSVPIPRGGGLAIVVLTLMGVGVTVAADILAPAVGAALGAGAAVAAVGWIDDRGSLGPVPRAIVQIAAATWALSWLGGLPALQLGAWSVPLGDAFGFALAAVGIVWVTNLFNFMDGIDGIAAAQGLTTAAGATVLLALSGVWGLATVAALVAGGCAGFLYWNWAPAKIFMGDVGSGFLGFVFAVLAVASERLSAVPVAVWGILLAPFLIDATFTLLRRLLRGERWYDAHRSHAYQRAVQAGLSHGRVASWIVILNVLLFVLAVLVHVHPDTATIGVAVAIAVPSGLYAAVERLCPMAAGPESKGRHRSSPVS